MRVRFPFSRVLGRKVKVKIYARFSTDEQNPSSIDNQFAYCLKFLADNGLGDADVEVETFQDPETSGEEVSRPGIDALKAVVESREVDVIVVEDSSRVYRNETAMMSFGETLHDHEIRLICINDDVDNAESNWHERLSDAAKHHARSNEYTSSRIKRRQQSAFDHGYALNQLRTGYKRTAAQPATEREPARGPFSDSIDEWQGPIIVECCGTGRPETG